MLKNFLNLLFPPRCLHCKKNVSEKFLCDRCYNSIEFTTDFLYPCSSQIYSRLEDEGLEIKFAMSMCFFHKDSAIQTLMHQLKYNGKKDIGVWLGEMYAEKLLHYGFDKCFDVIVPIPLHEERLKERGYNQSAIFANGISKVFKISVDESIVLRIKATDTQTQKNRNERFENMKDVFEVVPSRNIKDKNILLVDDTITTGATLVSCGEKILQCHPKSLSVITIAVAVD